MVKLQQITDDLGQLRLVLLKGIEVELRANSVLITLVYLQLYLGQTVREQYSFGSKADAHAFLAAISTRDYAPGDAPLPF